MNLTFADDIICAPATIPGTGAISIVRVSGKGCIELCDRVVSLKKGRLSDAAGYTLHFGTVFYRPGDGTPGSVCGAGTPGDRSTEEEASCLKSGSEEVLDEVLVSVFRAPHSYTGEDSVEISCHSSTYVVSALLALLTASGARLAQAGEFTRRAFLGGKMDLAQAEAVADVIASSSALQHRVAMHQLRGGYSAALRTLRSGLLEIASLLELELDFSEEDVEFADRGRLRKMLLETLGRCDSLAASFREGNAIRRGVPVAIVGATNTGKSTLLNALLGDDRAIVSDIPGTTRDTVEECCTIGGVQFRFIDTAGIRETDETVEKIGIERTFRKIDEAEIVLGVTDVSRGASTVAEEVSRILDAAGSKKVLFLVNKCDNISVINTDNIVSSIKNVAVGCKILPISARSGQGLEKLTAALSEVSSRLSSEAGGTLVTNERHYQALKSAAISLRRVLDGLDSGIPSDLLAQDLREALSHLGEITGEISTDEVLGEIFGRFCVGK